MIYHCPHCGTQNFSPPHRLRGQEKFPLHCWKCGKKIKIKVKKGAKKKAP